MRRPRRRHGAAASPSLPPPGPRHTHARPRALRSGGHGLLLSELFRGALDPERFNLANLFYEAIGADGSGKVLVLASNGYTETSMGGGTKLMRVQEHGLAGILTDGRLRDFDELAGYDFATYCSGETTRWGGGEVTPFQANVPVVLGGVGVMPGTYVFADSSGAVLIPPGDVEQVLDLAREIEADDALLSTADRGRASGGWSSRVGLER